MLDPSRESDLRGKKGGKWCLLCISCILFLSHMHGICTEKNQWKGKKISFLVKKFKLSLKKEGLSGIRFRDLRHT